MPSPDKPRPVITMQADVPLPPGVTDDSLASLAMSILHAEGVDGDWPLGIHFVDDRTMQAAHVEFMDIDEPTDIMTFPYAEADDDDLGPWMPDDVREEMGQGGDLLISVDRAAENAGEAGWSTAHELYFLVSHGILHLLGWDDASDDDRAAMLGRQRELLSGWSEAPEAMR
jgi:probable rRNA maturation factor